MQQVRERVDSPQVGCEDVSTVQDVQMERKSKKVKTYRVVQRLIVEDSWIVTAKTKEEAIEKAMRNEVDRNEFGETFETSGVVRSYRMKAVKVKKS